MRLREEGTWCLVEQQVCLIVDESDGRIRDVALLCSGFRPEPGAIQEDARSALQPHFAADAFYDAGGRGCAEGPLEEIAYQMCQLSSGQQLEVRATLAFVVGNTALSAGQDATVLLTIEGVCVATKGYSDELQAHGFEPLGELVSRFISAGGQLWVCGACAKPRGIGEADLVDGAKIVGAASAVEAPVTGAQTLSF